MISGKTECKHGHPFNAQNTRFDLRTGRRSCIECGRIRSREHQRKKRIGLPRLLAYTRDSDLYNENALGRLRASYQVNPVTGCWLWTGGTNPEGYGNFWYLGQTVSAHRAAYYLLVGEVEAELTLDHLCRKRNCVNPSHLEPVTERENILRGVGPAARNAQKTHCIRGHELVEENLMPGPLRQGHRFCRLCRPFYPSIRNQGAGRGPASDATTAGPSTGQLGVQP